MKNKHRTIIIVQARMMSTRLPGKALKIVLDKTLLGYELESLQKVKRASGLVVATSLNPADQQIIDFCKTLHISTFRGSEENVLERYYLAAKFFHADIVVRVSGDCPLIDSSIVDQAIEFFSKEPSDYVSNTLKRTFPRGMDVEVFSFASLEKAYQEASLEPEKEHVTPYIYHHPKIFRLRQFFADSDESNYRLTVDTQEDFVLVKRIIEHLYPQKQSFNLKDIVNLLKAHPDWALINAHVKQKPL